MVKNRVKVLSAVELDVWTADAETELPSEGSDAEAWHASADCSFEENHSETESVERSGTPPSRGGSGQLAIPRPLESAPVSLCQPTSGGPKAVFLDYDGTLREFEDRPDLAVPTAEVHDLLRALNDREDLRVHIISGRDAGFLKKHFDRYSRLILIAEHERRVAGRFQVWRPDTSDSQLGSRGVVAPKTELQDWRTPSRRELVRATATVPGSHIEEKAASLVWHFRGAIDDGKAEAAAKLLVSRLNKTRTVYRFRELRVNVGHKIVEVSCRNGTKGDIMRRLCDARKRVGRPFESVIIAGDDISDESMFDCADDNFLTIKVGQGKSHAKYSVEDPAQLRSFLWQLAA